MTTNPLSALGLAALEYSAERGWPVFPVEPRGKRPLVAGGFHSASTHPEAVCAWWDVHPDANIGFSPGAAGLLVLDFDRPEAETFAAELGLLDVPTLEVVTARGRHLYFRLPRGVTIGNVSTWAAAGIDVRSANGYVLLPPSVHPTGHVYTWRGELE